jgi:hypothetical protein
MLVIAVGYMKRDAIAAKLQSMLAKNDHTEEILKQFNNEPLEVVNDSLIINADSTVNVLFLGNSLTYCGVPEEEPDKTTRGLTSTSKDKDYVHQLVAMIAEGNGVNVNYSYTNIADFERQFAIYPFDVKTKLSNSKIQNPDILIVQIGENVAQADLTNTEVFKKAYLKLLSNYPESKRIITLPFWPDAVKQNIITDVALESKSYLVDLGHLGDGTDANNLASSQKHYKQPGVGAHPGDYGMKNIAKCLYAVIGAN